MKSKIAKVLHPVAGKPMVEYAVEAAEFAGMTRTVVVIGHQGDQVRQVLKERVEYAEQPEQRGTGDAVRCAGKVLQGQTDHVLVFYADMPLLEPETLRALVEKHQASGATCTMLTLISDDTMSFGRIVRNAGGQSGADCRRGGSKARRFCRSTK